LPDGTARLERAVRRRVRRDVGPPLHDLHARVVLDAGADGAVTVLLFDGAVAVRPGRHPEPTTRIRGTVDALVDVVERRASGVGAFPRPAHRRRRRPVGRRADPWLLLLRPRVRARRPVRHRALAVRLRAAPYLTGPR
jgi:hypothetical protein